MLTKYVDWSETPFELIKDKKEIGVTLLADISLRFVNDCPESKIMSLK